MYVCIYIKLNVIYYLLNYKGKKIICFVLFVTKKGKM